MKPKILVYAVMGPKPYTGGIENVVDTILRSSLTEEYEFEILDGYNEADFGRTRLRKAWNAIMLFLRCLAAMIRVGPHVVHIHVATHVDFWKSSLCMLAGQLTFRRTVFHLHGGGFDSIYEGYSPFTRFLVRRVFRRASRVIVLSSYWAEFVSAFVDRARIRVLPNPIECDSLAPPAGARSSGKHNVLLLGSLGRRKGHFDVLEAIPPVVREFPSVVFNFAGAEEVPGTEGQLRELVAQKGLEDHVLFLGRVTGQQKLDLLHSTTIMILPSHSENMPVSVLEGMGAGLPIIASRVAAVPELLESGRAGRLVDAGDWRALAEEIKTLLRDPDLAARLGREARRKACALWDVKIVASRLSAIYGELCPSGPD
jgi:glycosyltransferase involved in cell wall biosynthesis